MVKVQDSAKQRIYLACPYSNAKSHLHSENYELLKQLAIALTQEGHSVFSPIFQVHSLCEHGIEYDYGMWKDIAQSMILNWATDFYMLGLTGLDYSQNLEDEMKFSSQAKIPIRCFPYKDILSIIKDANFTIKTDSQANLSDVQTSAINKIYNDSYSQGWLDVSTILIAYAHLHEGRMDVSELFNVVGVNYEDIIANTGASKEDIQILEEYYKDRKGLIMPNDMHEDLE